MTGGSQQLRLFRRARRDGLDLKEAADAAGISLTEAQIHDAADRHSPPGPECFELLYDPEERNQTMADETPDPEAGEGGGIDGEYKRPDAAAAIKRYKDAISPKKTHISTLTGDLAEHYKFIKDDCHFPRKVLDFLMQLDDMEEAKRDHFLLALSLGMTELNLFVPRDLVTMANGDDGANVVPVGEPESGGLATLMDFDEASEDELEQQQSRPSTEQKKAEADAAAEEAPKRTRRKARPPESSASAETGAAVH